MASQLRFEGPILEDLLERVRTEVGPGARIVAANRVRKGGVGGFFSKEHFEVLVERPDGTAGAAPAPAAPPAAAAAPRASAQPTAAGAARVPSSILDLAEVVNDVERRAARPAAAAATAAGGPVTGPVTDLTTEDDGDGHPFTPHPTAPRFAAPADPMRMPPVPVGPRAAHDDDVVIDLVDETPRISTESAAFAAVLDRITRAADAAVDEDIDTAPLDLDEHRPPPMAPPVQERLRSTTDTARRSATAARVIEDAPVEPVLEPDDVAVIEHPERPAVFRRATREEVIERPENRLQRMGLPARLVPRGRAAGELRGALTQSLSRLPTPPLLPDSPGVVVAVVGTGAEVEAFARDLAEDYGVDPERVVRATRDPEGEGIPAWLHVCDGATAEERRRSWRRRKYPTIVACSLPAGRRDLDWTREILDHLEPTCTWAVVDASWKSEDVQYWADELGGVDALALTNLDDTTSPASVLELGIPVGRLEHRPATPVSWTDMLIERLSDGDGEGSEATR